MRIAIVNDKPMVVDLLNNIIGSSPHSVAWVASNGADAITQCVNDLPDLILMEMVMPGMSGVDASKSIAAATPCPILVVTASVAENASMVFDAMGAGALDVVETPVINADGVIQGEKEFFTKLRRIEKLLGLANPRTARAIDIEMPAVKINLLAIGSSTGGPNAVAQVVKSLPVDFPAAIVVIQHVDEAFAGGFAEWLNTQTALGVKIAKNGDKLKHGTIYVASTNNHLIYGGTGRLKYTDQHQEIVYRPSVDVFFNSLDEYWKGNMLAVLLTGMGKDGASGLLRLRKKGVYTIAQDEETCAVYGMPRAAAEMGAAETIQPLENISQVIKQQMKNLT